MGELTTEAPDVVICAQTRLRIWIIYTWDDHAAEYAFLGQKTYFKHAIILGILGWGRRVTSLATSFVAVLACLLKQNLCTTRRSLRWNESQMCIFKETAEHIELASGLNPNCALPAKSHATMVYVLNKGAPVEARSDLTSPHFTPLRGSSDHRYKEENIFV